MTAELSLQHYFSHHFSQQRDNPAAALVENGKTVSHGQLIESVLQLAGQLNQSGQSSWVLACSDCGGFTRGLLALLAAGKTVYLPANSCPGSLELLGQHTGALLTDGDGAGYPHQVVQLSAAASSQPLQKLAIHDARLVFYTSGSSGTPKAVFKQLSQLEGEINALENLWGPELGQSDVLACVSHQHIYGVLFRILWPLLSGRTIDATQYEYPESLLNRIQNNHSSVVIASPAQLERLPRELNWSACHNKVAAVFSSGAPLSALHAGQTAHCFGCLPYEVFGSTETGGVAWRQQPDSEQTCYWNPLPGFNTGLADGQLCIYSPWTESSRTTPFGIGFIMGDKAERLDDGRFLTRGRADQITKIEGKRVSLTEIALHLRASNSVDKAEVVVLDGPRRQLGAVIVLSPQGQQQLEQSGRLAVSRSLKQELANYFEAVTLPRKWRYLSALPVNSQGKLVRAELAQYFLEAQDHIHPIDSQKELSHV